MRTLSTVFCVLVAGVMLSGCALLQKPVTTESLLKEMTDLKGLAQYPAPPFTCKQFSSYDRRSKSATQPERPQEGWFANADVGQYLRVEEQAGRQEYVMMDTNGPGAIVRVWSANPKGTLRIYLDGSDAPVIEAPMADFLGGAMPGIPKPIAGEYSKGWSSYFPIPYARHCKVTSDQGEFYYHVNYRTYPKGTRVVTFEPKHLEELSDRIQETATALAGPRGAAGATAPTDWFSDPTRWVDLNPGQDWRWEAQEAGGAVYELAVRVRAADRDAALRQLWLTGEFDGCQTVACPLGDFFGAAPGLCSYESLPSGIAPDGTLWAHWVMPYRQTAQLRIENRGAQPVHLGAHVYDDRFRWTGRSMHFFAKWRTEFDVPTRPMRDWNYLSAHGKGVFVGAAFAIANPTKHWWGEGDEKIYVDGETFPSHFGTGTEDYYGYAWCCNVPFTHAYHNQPRCDGPSNYGHTAVNRWHILDRIPFQKDFRFDMELWHWNDKCKVTMSVVSYWYARPGATDDLPAVRDSDLRLLLLPPYVAPRVPGAFEGEEMRVIEKTARVEPQPIDPCSNESHLWWHDGCKPGDRLVLGFPVPQAGRYHVRARFVKANDYGIVDLTIAGQKAMGPFDLYNDGVAVSEEIDLGAFDLVKGENPIEVQIVGANPKAIKSYLFGLDYVRLDPVPFSQPSP